MDYTTRDSYVSPIAIQLVNSDLILNSNPSISLETSSEVFECHSNTLWAGDCVRNVSVQSGLGRFGDSKEGERGEAPTGNNSVARVAASSASVVCSIVLRFNDVRRRRFGITMEIPRDDRRHVEHGWWNTRAESRSRCSREKRRRRATSSNCERTRINAPNCCISRLPRLFSNLTPMHTDRHC